MDSPTFWKPVAMNTNDDIEKQEDIFSNSSAVATPSASISGLSKSNCKFAWRDISYAVDTPSGKKQILQTVSGCVEKGTFSPLL
jgi:hypothetical protein